ncbi:MAG: hypothetical protein E5W44_11175, partial [Mesorhizobium sp.]
TAAAYASQSGGRPEGNLPANCAICSSFAQTDGGAMYRLWASMTHPMQRMTRICIRVRQGMEIARYRPQPLVIGTLRA